VDSRFAFVLVLMISIPYLLIAASHDLGGARGWIPASRYMVVLVPVFAIGMAAWLGAPGVKKLRWYVLFVGATASFWIAQGMLEEPNYVYDRPAFLASRHVNVSPLLGIRRDECNVFFFKPCYPIQNHKNRFR
jgi:hypothetical protein